jgi:hypothetical protein
VSAGTGTSEFRLERTSVNAADPDEPLASGDSVADARVESLTPAGWLSVWRKKRSISS